VPSYFTPRETIPLDAFLADLDKPGILLRFKALAPADRELVALEMMQFQRAEDGARIRPDLLPNGAGFARGEATSSAANHRDSSAPVGYATPFSPRETHRPDRDPETLQRMRERTTRFHAEVEAAELQERMGTDADRPLEPPTLRDQLEAAMSIHTDGET
jgi:hypothetical protein